MKLDSCEDRYLVDVGFGDPPRCAVPLNGEKVTDGLGNTFEIISMGEGGPKDKIYSHRVMRAPKVSRAGDYLNADPGLQPVTFHDKKNLSELLI